MINPFDTAYTNYFCFYHYKVYEILHKISTLSECLMDHVDISGRKVGTYTKVNNVSTCQNKCQKNRRCSVWTYHEGDCYLKDQNTSPFHRSGAISGINSCNKSGMF